MRFLRGKLAENWLALVRLYTFNFPVRKGKVRLYELAMNMCAERPEHRIARTFDGRRINVNLTDGIADAVYFLGEYEREISRVMLSVIGEGNICLDVGANYGWHTTLFRSRCGNSGQVHAFEPSPVMFEKLEKNVALLEDSSNVFLNLMALGNEAGTVTLHSFPGLTVGHNSLSTLGQDDFVSWDVRMITLDSYLANKGIDRVDFVKVDIEGAEMMFFQGAGRLLEIDPPPVFMVEMALNTSKNFDYLPNDLIEFIRARGDYEFFVINEYNGSLRQIAGFAPDDIGANVLCIPGARKEALSFLF